MMTTGEAARDRRIKSLDGFRLWAIVLIIADHTAFIPENGPVGVGLMFVLSGFLTVYATKGHGFEDDYLSLKKWGTYYIRKIFRIIPLYYLCIIALYLFYPEYRFTDFGQMIRHLTFQECTVHFWFLQQEVFMYLFTPPLLFIIAMLRKPFKDKAKAEWVTVLLLIVLSAACFIHSPFMLLGAGKPQEWRMYFYMMGMATAYLCRKADGITLNTAGIVAANIIMALSFIFTIVPSPRITAIFGLDTFQTFWASAHEWLFGVLAIIWISAAALCREGIVSRFFGNPVFSHLAVISYGMYLFHFQLIYILGLGNGGKLFIMVTFISICISEVLYVIYEKPLGDFGKHLSFRKLIDYYRNLCHAV
ncbi:MAG: acyltransferase [Lachnospiraceae bacterium]|nr:acyltransferase [Lachnospiraceae bacterium]